MNCIVCRKSDSRPTLRFVNSKGAEIHIHGHHRMSTIFKAGYIWNFTDKKHSRSKNRYVSQT